MAERPSLEWLFLDLNGYFASVEQQVNPDLFDAGTVSGPTLRERREKLSVAMDLLNRRYGRDTIVLGALLEPMANFTGTKVANLRNFTNRKNA